jgi:hypothetical protein
MPKHDDPSPAEPTVTLTQAQFTQLLAAREPGVGLSADVLEKLLTRIQPRGQYDDKLTPARQEELRRPPPRKGYRKLSIKSARGSVCVGWCERGPNGETIFREPLPSTYQYPKTAMVHQASGGLVPDGIQIVADGAAHGLALLATGTTVQALLGSRACTPYYVGWLYNTFGRVDFSEEGWGRAGGLRASDVDPAGEFGWDTPWDDAVAEAASEAAE